MEQTTECFTGFCLTPCESDCAALESVQFNEEIERIIAPHTENLTSFTALLELPPAQAKEILHSPPNCDGAVAGALCHINEEKPQIFHSLSGNLTLPSDSALIERAAKFSAFAEKNSSPAEINLTPRPRRKVKSEPVEKTDSNPNQIEDKNEKAAKRKELDKEDKESSKKSKSGVDERCGDREKLPYIHVRARRGEATDSHSLAERARREKINARMKLLQELVPGCNKISGTALVLDEIINHVQSLQRQVEFLSMKLAAVNPKIDFDLDSILATAGVSRMECTYPNMVTPPVWQDVPVNGNGQQYQQPWQFDVFNQPIWVKEEVNRNFMTPENSLLSHDSLTNSASMKSK